MRRAACGRRSMPRLVSVDSTLRDLAGIAADIEAFTGGREAALASVTRSTRHCERTAELPGLLGRRRPELRSDCRSIAAGSCLVLVRTLDEGGLRAILEVIHVLHGARDLTAFFRRTSGDR